MLSRHYSTEEKWKNGLMEDANDETVRLYKDKFITIIPDKFPKAKFHFLVLPNKFIDNFTSLTTEDIPLLKHMRREGEKITKNYVSETPFRFGFHAIPNMSLLHMHVISSDTNSSRMKTVKHFNAFSTKYFIDYEEILEMLEKNQPREYNAEFIINYENELKKPIRCHVCNELFATNGSRLSPQFKHHIARHFQQNLL